MIVLDLSLSGEQWLYGENKLMEKPCSHRGKCIWWDRCYLCRGLGTEHDDLSAYLHLENTEPERARRLNELKTELDPCEFCKGFGCTSIHIARLSFPIRCRHYEQLTAAQER
jgi:hypothetical protein